MAGDGGDELGGTCAVAGAGVAPSAGTRGEDGDEGRSCRGRNSRSTGGRSRRSSNPRAVGAGDRSAGVRTGAAEPSPQPSPVVPREGASSGGAACKCGADLARAGLVAAPNSPLKNAA